MLIRSLSEKNYRLYFVYILIFALIAASSLVCLNVMRQYVNDETIRTIRAMEEISLSKINDRFKLSLGYTRSLAATIAMDIKDVNSPYAFSL